MILEADEENREFVTVYKKDYYPKQIGRTPKCIQPADYSSPLNPLNGPFHCYLNSRRKNDRASLEERTEDIGDNLKKVRDKYRHLHKILPDITPDERVVESEEKKTLKTIYQLEYPRHDDDYLSPCARCIGGYRSAVTLPDDWIIPETIHKASYRNPRDFTNPADEACARKIAKPANNLGLSEKERDILRIATGSSEYVDVIGATGRRIFDEQNCTVLPLLRRPPSPRVKGPDSIRSECSDLSARRHAPFISHDL